MLFMPLFFWQSCTKDTTIVQGLLRAEEWLCLHASKARIPESCDQTDRYWASPANFTTKRSFFMNERRGVKTTTLPVTLLQLYGIYMPVTGTGYRYRGN